MNSEANAGTSCQPVTIATNVHVCVLLSIPVPRVNGMDNKLNK